MIQNSHFFLSRPGELEDLLQFSVECVGDPLDFRVWNLFYCLVYQPSQSVSLPSPGLLLVLLVQPLYGNVDGVSAPRPRPASSSHCPVHSLPRALARLAPVLLQEESHQELSLLPPVEGGRYDDVPARGQHHPLADLPQVDVLVSLLHRSSPPHHGLLEPGHPLLNLQHDQSAN